MLSNPTELFEYSTTQGDPVSTTVYFPTIDSACTFVIHIDGQIEPCKAKPLTKHFQRLSLTSRKLGKCPLDQLGFSIWSQSILRCYCQKDCIHQENTNKFPYNELASGIVNNIKDSHNSYSRYWISGDCILQFDEGYLTPDQLKLFALGKN